LQEENTTKRRFSLGLKTLLKERGITQTVLAENMGVTQATVSRWFNGSIPGGDKLTALSKVLAVSPEQLLTGSDAGGVELAVQAAAPVGERARALAKRIEALPASKRKLLENMIKEFEA